MHPLTKKPTNILLVSQFLTGGGLERMVHLLGGTLAREHGCRVFLYCFDGDKDDPALREYLSRNLGVIAIYRQKKGGFSWSSIRDIAALIRQNQIEVVHTHETAPLMYAAIARILSLRKPRIVHTQHSFIHLQTRAFIRFYDRFFQKFANVLTVVSAQVRDEYVKMGLPAARAEIIENGVELAEKALNKAEKKALRLEFADAAAKSNPALSDFLRKHADDRWIISVARVHPKKGQDNLIRVWGSVSAAVQGKCVMIFVGPETEKGEKAKCEKLIAQVTHPERLAFAGETRTPVRWLQAADIFMSGSEYEGMPLAPIEAMGASVPCLLSDIPGHALLGRLGAGLFDFQKPETGARKIEALVGELESDTGMVEGRVRNITSKIRDEYSISGMTRKYYELYS